MRLNDLSSKDKQLKIFKTIALLHTWMENNTMSRLSQYEPQLVNNHTPLSYIKTEPGTNLVSAGDGGQKDVHLHIFPLNYAQTLQLA